MSNGRAKSIPLHHGVEVVPASGAPLADKEVPAQYTPFGAMIAGWCEPMPTETKAGLIIGEEAAKQFVTQVVRIVAVGPDVKQVKVGDRILASSNVPVHRVFVDNLASVVMREDSIIGVLPKADNA